MSENKAVPTIDVASNLGLHEKKVDLEQVPELVRVIGRETATTFTHMSGFFMANAMGYAVLAYLDFELSPEQQKEKTLLESDIESLESADLALDILALIAKAKSNEEKTRLIASLPDKLALRDMKLAAMRVQLVPTMNGACLAFRDAYSSAIRYGEVRSVLTHGTVHGNLTVGKHTIKFGKRFFMFHLLSDQGDWIVYKINADTLVKISSSKQVEKSACFVDGTDSRIKSPTRAMKACKASMAYRGYSGTDAIAEALSVSFESLSAGNPRPSNFYAYTGK